MPRVLIVHYHFLPVHNVAVKRLLGYARHLPAFGWEPMVLTRAWPDLGDADPSWGLSWEPDLEAAAGIPIHRVSHPARRERRRPSPDDWWPLRKARSLAEMVGGRYPDEFRAWTRPAVEAARELYVRQPFDAVLTYCPPETNHLVGGRIARALGVPWIPFFGDLYGFFLAPLPPRSPGGAIRRALHHRWMAPAAGCVSVTPYMVEYLSRTYDTPAEMVLTGFDPDDWRLAPPPRLDRFVLSHVGSVYPADQRPGILFDGLDALLGSDPSWADRLEVRFVGSKCDAWLHTRVTGRPCAAVTRIEPKVPSAVARARVAESHAVLAFNCTLHRDEHGTMSHPTKVFEALGARRPVLAIPPDGDWVDALLARTRGGVGAVDPASVAAVLREWLGAWHGGGAVPYSPDPVAVAELTTARQTARLAAWLSAVAGRTRTPPADRRAQMPFGSGDI